MSIADVNGKQILVKGGVIKIGEIFDECWLESDLIGDPELIVDALKENNKNIDIFTFSQKLPETKPIYNYHMEWDNVAAIPIATYDDWWMMLPQATRKNVRRSAKRGVTIREVEFDDEFVRGIVNLYNETPIRQGRRFWHYGKDYESTKKANSTYLDKSDIIGAYLDNELIGFIKVAYTGEEARIMQIIAMVNHQDKRPTNALLERAVRIAINRGAKYFIYGKYVYGDRTDAPIIEFKNRNGFQQINIPKYFVPLTLKGRLAMALGLHKGFVSLLPVAIRDLLIKIRADWYERSTGRTVAINEKK